MDETNDILLLTLEKLRRDLLSQLVELTHIGRKPADAEAHKAKAENIVKEFHKTEAMLASMQPNKAKKYANYRKAIFAVLAYLDATGHAVEKHAIAEALVAGGLILDSEPGTKSNILRSIGSYITGQHRDSKVLRTKNDLIGRYEWDDSYFTG